jgi:hypothetical protein
MTLPLARIKKIMKFDEDVKVWPPHTCALIAPWAIVCVRVRPR